MFPKGVESGTAKPVGPEPVSEAFRVGAMVKVDVNALSRVEFVMPAVAWCQITSTALVDKVLGDEVCPRRYTGPERVMLSCSV